MEFAGLENAGPKASIDQIKSTKHQMTVHQQTKDTLMIILQ